MSDRVDAVKLVVDTDVCVGIGQCEMLEADTFVYDEDAGFATVREGVTLPADRADAVMRACPSGAISIDNSGGAGGASGAGGDTPFEGAS